MNNAFYSRPLFEHNEVSFEGRRERDDVEQRRGNKYRRESRQWPLYTVGELKKKKKRSISESCLIFTGTMLNLTPRFISIKTLEADQSAIRAWC